MCVCALHRGFENVQPSGSDVSAGCGGDRLGLHHVSRLARSVSAQPLLQLVHGRQHHRQGGRVQGRLEPRHD